MLFLKPGVTKKNRELFFRRICMESSEHIKNWANIAETICPEMLVFGKWASWMLLFSEYPDKSHNLTPYSYHI